MTRVLVRVVLLAWLCVAAAVTATTSSPPPASSARMSSSLDASSSSNAAPSPATLRVLTYNIHHGEGTDREFDLVRLAGVMMRADPDLVALQEVDQGTERAARVNQLSELARLTGMHGAFGKAMAFDGGEYGVGVLSRWPLLNVENHGLPGLPDREPRTALTVEVNPEGGAPLLEFTSTHLDQGRETGNRLTQAQSLNQLLARDDEVPTILAGDMNSRIDTDVMQLLREWWTDAFAYPPPVADPPVRPRSDVDYVLVRPAGHWRTIESQVVDAPLASDHRPVLVVLEWTTDR